MPTLAPRTSQEEIDALLEQASATATDRRRQKRARQKKIIVGAIIGSILLHVILAPVLLWVMAHWPRKQMHGSGPFNITVVRSNEEEKDPNAPSTQTEKPYMRTIPEQKTDQPVDKADFQSDNSTLEAADQPADPNKPPLPSQAGREIPTYDFKTSPYRPGKEASEAASAASQASQGSAAAPDQTPQPENKTKAPDSKNKATARNAQPTPTPRPAGELAMVKAEPTPADQPPEPTETPSNATPPPSAQRATSQPSRAIPNTVNSVNSTGLPRPPGYQPQTVQSKMSGSINNRGRPAVRAQETPLGRYEKAVQDAIGSVWYMDVERQMSTIMTSSEVRLHFYVTRGGIVRGVRVSKGDENSSLASISFGSVTQAQIAPMPPEVAQVLPGGELEVDMGFALFAQ